jgi:hypothetical protein
MHAGKLLLLKTKYSSSLHSNENISLTMLPITIAIKLEIFCHNQKLDNNPNIIAHKQVEMVKWTSL